MVLLSRIVKTITAERIGSRRFSPKAKCDIGTACCALSIAREIVLTSRIFRWGRWNRSGHPRQSLRNCVFFCIASITTGNSQFREKMVKTTTKDWC